MCVADGADSVSDRIVGGNRPSQHRHLAVHREVVGRTQVAHEILHHASRDCRFKVSADRVSEERNQIGRVRPSVSTLTFKSQVPILDRDFCMSLGYGNSSPRIEIKVIGQGQLLWLRLAKLVTCSV